MSQPSSWAPARSAIVAALTTTTGRPRALPFDRLFQHTTPAEIIARPASLKLGSATAKRQGPACFVIFRDGQVDQPGVWEMSTIRRAIYTVQITCWYWLGSDMASAEVTSQLTRVAEDEQRVLAALCYPGALATDPSGNDTGLDGGSLRAEGYRCIGPDPTPIQRGETDYRVLRTTMIFPRITMELLAPT